jgi:hypothetical protein
MRFGPSSESKRGAGGASAASSASPTSTPTIALRQGLYFGVGLAKKGPRRSSAQSTRDNLGESLQPSLVAVRIAGRAGVRSDFLACDVQARTDTVNAAARAEDEPIALSARRHRSVEDRPSRKAADRSPVYGCWRVSVFAQFRPVDLKLEHDQVRSRRSA